jgi:multidrug efflux pump subunit AcrA (membrane-fusion protein)
MQARNLMTRWRTAFARDPKGVLLRFGVPLALLLVLLFLFFRGLPGGNGKQAAAQPGGPQEQGGPVAVDVVLAREGSLRGELEYTGTTRPTREVSLRAQAEGRLLELNVDVGDRVRRGQVLARLDDELLRTAVRQAESELASRQSEVAAARSQVGDARTQVEHARLDLSQRNADFQRLWRLWGQGYASRQSAEQAQTAVRLGKQVLRSAEEQVRNLQASVRAAESRVAAQRAVLAQERERLTYAVLRSPVDGFVTGRFTELGNLVQTGGEVLRLGDFRIVQVDVEVSELELSRVSVGQEVRVRLDALGDVTFIGRVDRISPQADPVSRLVPVTITLANPENRIGAGLLARVRFGSAAQERVLIPESALQAGQGRGRGGTGGAGTGGRRTEDENRGTVFVLEGEGRAPEPPGGNGGQNAAPAEPAKGTDRVYTVRERQIEIAARGDGQAEVRSGLEAGDRVVSRSSGALEDGAEVRPSILSAEALSAAPGAGRERREERPPVRAIPPAGRGSGLVGAGDPGRSSGSATGRSLSGGTSISGPRGGGFQGGRGPRSSGFSTPSGGLGDGPGIGSGQSGLSGSGTFGGSGSFGSGAGTSGGRTGSTGR